MDIDISYYIKTNKDLNGMSLIQGYNHWINYGCKENRDITTKLDKYYINTKDPCDNNNNQIQGLWISSLNDMCYNCINSYIDNGHDFNLYLYEFDSYNPNKIQNTKKLYIHNANDILKYYDVYYDNIIYYSAFSNIFRYKLLLENGGWWVDMDTICNSNFNTLFDLSNYAFFYEKQDILGSCVIKCGSKNSHFAKYCYDKSIITNKYAKWGDIGPKLVNEAVIKLNLNKYKYTNNIFTHLFNSKK